MNVVFVTGNEHKAKWLSRMVGIKLPHEKVDVEEIQSLDLREIIEHKARTAFTQLQRPVVVEDTKLSFRVLGALPGPFIKWFREEIGDAGLCKLLDGYDDRTAFAGAAIAYFDGHELEIFEREYEGTITAEPRGTSGYGWNKIFVPKGADRTLGEMTDEEFAQWYMRIKPIDELTGFLRSLDNK